MRQVADRLVLRLGRRLRPAVVLADEYDRHLPELGEVHRLVEGADVGRAVAEERDRDARLAAHLEGERRADHGRQAAADDGVRAHVAAGDVVEVHRAAVAVRAALDLAVQLGHHLVRRRPVGEHVPVRAVGRADHVVLLERAADADGDRLLADARMQETGEVAGAEALLDLLLETPDQQHLAEELDQLLARQMLLPEPKALASRGPSRPASPRDRPDEASSLRSGHVQQRAACPPARRAASRTRRLNFSIPSVSSVSTTSS